MLIFKGNVINAFVFYEVNISYLIFCLIYTLPVINYSSKLNVEVNEMF